MFDYRELREIHLEISNLCQASCPMCTRNIHGGLKNPLLNDSSWTFSDYKNILTSELLLQLKKIMFCGNFGDPIMNSDLIKMCRYTTEINPNIEIRIHTNGGARNKVWWKELVSALPKNHMVVFAIDGLKGTHELYRIGTTFERIIENAIEYINNGGRAEWAYLRFKHNQHQVDEAKNLATSLGFENFVMKDSSRFLLKDNFDVFDKDGNTTHQLEISDFSNLSFIDEDIILNYKSIIDESSIDCFVLKTKEVYIDAHMNLYPCCWLGQLPYIPKESEIIVNTIRNEITDQYYKLINSLGGINNINVKKKSIKEIINSVEYQNVWKKYWHTEKLITCVRTCGISKRNISKPNDQFITKDILK